MQTDKLYFFPGPLFQKVAPIDPGLEMPKCDFNPEPYQVIQCTVVQSVILNFSFEVLGQTRARVDES